MANPREAWPEMPDTNSKSPAVVGSPSGIPQINMPPVSLRRRLTEPCHDRSSHSNGRLVLLPLFAISLLIWFIGASARSISLSLTQTPKPVGEPGGGMANAIVGSMVILAIASVLGVPLGIGAGIFLSEYGRNRYGDIVRFVSDVLNGVPSIVIGIVAYGLVVMRQKHFSALAGGVALAIMMIPTIARTTEQMLLLVPQAIREAAYGLGVSRWRTTLSFTLRTATSGVITGVMLAFARVAGETAPLLFYGFWKPILELEVRSADCGLIVTDFYLRDFAF